MQQLDKGAIGSLARAGAGRGPAVVGGTYLVLTAARQLPSWYMLTANDAALLFRWQHPTLGPHGSRRVSVRHPREEAV